MSTKTKVVYIQLLGEENACNRAYVLKLTDFPIKYFEEQINMRYINRQKYKNGEPSNEEDDDCSDITHGYLPYKAIYKFEGKYNKPYCPSENEELVYVIAVIDDF